MCITLKINKHADNEYTRIIFWLIKDGFYTSVCIVRDTCQVFFVGLGVNEVEMCILFGPISFFAHPHPGPVSLHLFTWLYSFFILIFSICFTDDFIVGFNLAQDDIWDLIKNYNLEGWE